MESKSSKPLKGGERIKRGKQQQISAAEKTTVSFGGWLGWQWSDGGHKNPTCPSHPLDLNLRVKIWRRREKETFGEGENPDLDYMTLTRESH
ncbi:hypothetical protein L195_g055044, partial [Trifolium pratense]